MVKLPDPPPVAELRQHSPHILQLPAAQALWRIHDSGVPAPVVELATGLRVAP